MSCRMYFRCISSVVFIVYSWLCKKSILLGICTWFACVMCVCVFCLCMAAVKENVRKSRVRVTRWVTRKLYEQWNVWDDSYSFQFSNKLNQFIVIFERIYKKQLLHRANFAFFCESFRHIYNANNDVNISNRAINSPLFNTLVDIRAVANRRKSLYIWSEFVNKILVSLSGLNTSIRWLQLRSYNHQICSW